MFWSTHKYFGYKINAEAGYPVGSDSSTDSPCPFYCLQGISEVGDGMLAFAWYVSKWSEATINHLFKFVKRRLCVTLLIGFLEMKSWKGLWDDWSMTQPWIYYFANIQESASLLGQHEKCQSRLNQFPRQTKVSNNATFNLLFKPFIMPSH